jgi:hypothetical protein
VKLKMTIEEALYFADEWSRGMTLTEGSQGWRVVCLLLAEEVRRQQPIEAAALRKDAERYRYLRDRVPAEVLGQVKSAAGCWIDGEDEEGAVILLTGDDADAAIDAAMLAARAVGAA